MIMKSSKLYDGSRRERRKRGATAATGSGRSHKKENGTQSPLLWLQRNASGRGFTVWFIPEQLNDQPEPFLWLRLNAIGKGLAAWVKSLFGRRRKSR